MDATKIAKYVLLRKVKAETKPLNEEDQEDWIKHAEEYTDEELNEKMESTAKSGGERLPILSVGSEEKSRDVTIVKFLEDIPEPKANPKDPKKLIAYTKVELLRDHAGWDSKLKKVIPLKKGDIASINLKRHGGLWYSIQDFKPLTNKSLIIANLGKIKMAKGQGYDYRITPLA